MKKRFSLLQNLDFLPNADTFNEEHPECVVPVNILTEFICQSSHKLKLFIRVHVCMYGEMALRFGCLLHSSKYFGFVCYS